MFITGAGPLGALPNQGQGLWDPSLDTDFAFDFTDPNAFLKQNLQNFYLLAGKQAAFRADLQNMATGRGENVYGNFKTEATEAQLHHLRANDFDQTMVWYQNTDDPNDAFRGPTANSTALNGFAVNPGHNSNRVSLSSSSSNNHGNIHVRPQTNVNPSTGGLKTEPGAANIADPWSAPPNTANVNQNFAQPANTRGSKAWPSVSASNNDYIQAYGFPGGMADGLPVFPNNQGFPPSFDLGPAMGGLPNIDSSSSSSCRVNNGSSPASVFGSFSSSIGPPDMMDMDAREECFHSPSVFPSEALPSCHNPGAIPQAFMSRSPVYDLPMHPRAGAAFGEAQTVSPKMLHLNAGPSLPSSSSSESLHNPFRMDSDNEVQQPPVAPVSQKDILPSSAWQGRHESHNNKSTTAGRKQLPDKAPHSNKASGSSSGPKRRHGFDGADDKVSGPSTKKTKGKGKATSHSSHSQPKAQPSSHHHHHHHRGQHAGGSSHHDKAGPSHSKASSSSSSKVVAPVPAPRVGAGFGSSVPEASTSVISPRSERDEYLVQSKLSGMTYKEIRKQGNFTEAESTLRGRFRTLTKPKEARVRKPEFQEIDDKLLKRAVVKLTKGADEITRDDVPWKLVAEYMVSHGGSYLFGYTTVRKRWEYLMVTSDEQVRQDRLNQRHQN